MNEDFQSAVTFHGRNSAPVILLDMWREGEIFAEELPACLAYAWTLCEFPGRALGRAEWLELFREAGYHDHDGNPVERPDIAVTVWRGASPDERKRGYGMSWSTDRDKAQWFADRFPGGVLFEAIASPSKILADYRHDERSESELVVSTLGAPVSPKVRQVT